MDALTKAFVLCYDERPENPIERLVEVVADNAKVLGASSELKSRLINTELELKQARSEIDVLRKQLSDLGVSPNSTNAAPATNNVATGNGPAIATLSAEAEKTVPSSNTSAVEAAAVNTGAIPKTPKATQGSPLKNATTENATTTTAESETVVTAAADSTNPPTTTTTSVSTDAKPQEETPAVAAATTTASTNTEESTTKEAAT